MSKKYTLIPSQIVARPGKPRNKKNFKKQLNNAVKKNELLWLHFEPIAIDKKTRTVTMKVDLPKEGLDKVDLALGGPITMSLSKEAKDRLKIAYKKGEIDKETYQTFIK